MLTHDAIPLFSSEAEQSVIGGLLIDPEAFDKVADLLSPEDFYTEAHACLFRHIARMVADRKPLDAVTLAEEVDLAGDSPLTGGLAYIGQVQVNTPSAASIARHAEVIIEKRRIRGLLAASSEIADLARMSGGEPAADRIDKAQAAIMRLTEDVSESGDPVAIGVLLSEVIEQIEARADLDDGISGLSTGFPDLDAATCGLQKGDLIIIAGRPSMGKTTFALNIAENAAMRGELSVVFSMEMGRCQLAERSIASIGGVPTKAMRSGRLEDEHYTAMSYALSRLHAAPLVIDDAPSLSVQKMLSRCRRIARKQATPLRLVVIDYLQLMRGSGNNRNEELGDITRGLKLLARELDCPVILLSQLSRKCEERTDKRPLMSDLRESGAIEQDADVVVMMYRDDYYNDDSPYAGMAEAILRKQRMGALGTIPLVFQGEFSRFRNADKGAFAEAFVRAKESGQKTAKRGFA